MEQGNKYAADIDSITRAQQIINPYVSLTPIMTFASLNCIVGNTFFFKAECFQKSGAFKFKGASNAVVSLNEEQAAKGVVTHSSGNHGAALSLAAQLRGIPVYVVLPNTAPKCKVANVKRFGGKVIFGDVFMSSREETTNRVLQETGAILVPSSNDARIISGQGTLALEFLDQVPQLDTIIIPISVIGAKSGNPAIRVLGAEPRGADDAAQSKACEKLITLSQPNTIADGLRASIEEKTWPIIRDLVDDTYNMLKFQCSIKKAFGSV